VHILQKLAKTDVHSLSLSTEDASLQQELNDLQNTAIEMGFSLVWDLPVPYSQYNPIALELQQGGERMTKGAGNAWLYVEPDGDVLPAQGINRVLGNLLKDDWSSIWKKR
jgi:MoaA/NifB/PqqE/SkfB family radical SAM enzyme